MKSTVSVLIIAMATILLANLTFSGGVVVAVQEAQLSAETEQCVECHQLFTPGIVADWRSSRHSNTTPAAALQQDELERRISTADVPAELKEVAVGCYECHSRNLDKHQDSFDHEGFEINVVVSPNDCNTCHPREVEEYTGSKKAEAADNLRKNPVYHALVDTILGVEEFREGELTHLAASDYTKGDACFACHGTEVKVDGMKTVESDYGEMEVPNLVNWPNQGVGRINPDGSKGSCSACHARHAFSIEVARKPYTCAQCHLEPDVPAWDVYRESKHGNIFLSTADRQNWEAVPWTVGEDFNVPTCAACHNSLIVNAAGDVVAERTHDFGARLWVRLFSLIYSHPQPRSGATWQIKNADGLPLPTTFGGTPASEYLIDADEQAARRSGMIRICTSCHSTQWAQKHFDKMENTIAETDKMVAAATQLMAQAWEKGLADKTNPFDEALERKWISQWLFYANSIRYASAMGGPDYAAFKNGWWNLGKNLQDMKDMIRLKESAADKAGK